MDLSGDMPVTLTIKAPNQRLEDQTVDCMLGWTIRKLKQHLENVYPSKPKHNEQRLIYSGRLLQDHLTLKEILRQYEGSELPSNTHTVHLVCSSSSESSFSASEPKAAAETVLPQPVNSDQSKREATASSFTEGLRHRGSHNHGDDLHSRSQVPHSLHQSSTFPDQAAHMNPDLPYSPEHYAWMMQQYAYSQYMLQYMQYYQAAYYSGAPYNGQMLPPNLTPQPATNVDRQPQAAAGPAPRANVRMNAQGGVQEEDEDEGEPRDWLHHVYFLMRFLTFMGILFFYSNLTRFLVVFAGSICVFLLQKLRKNWQRLQREQQQLQQQQQETPPNQQEQSDQVQQNAETTPPEAEAEQRNDVPTEPTEPPQQPEVVAENEAGRLSRALLFFCTTVQSFFTSLLPTPPELLEAN